MSKEKFRYDICGRFIFLKDLNEGKAYIEIVISDSHFIRKEFETVC